LVKGPLGQKYIEAVLRGACDKQKSNIDYVYGIYLHKDELMFGNKHFDVDDADIIIDDVRYADTPGLYELIFKKILDLLYREDNMNKYKSMLLKVMQGAIDVCVCARSSPTRTRLLSNR